MHLSKGRCGLVWGAAMLAGVAAAEEPGGFQARFAQEFSVGGIARVGSRDPGLIGGGNGGTGKSVNFDDGNLNYGRGLASFAAQGRSTVTGGSEHVEVGLEAVYFYDFLNANGDTDFHDLKEEARDRAGRGIYLNDAFVGTKQSIGDAELRLRAGNQLLRWSESTSFGQSIAPVNPVSASRRYQPGNTAKDLVVALPMLSAELTTARNWALSGFYLLGFEPTEPEAAGTFLSANDYYSLGARYLQLGEGSPAVPDEDASVTTAAHHSARACRGAPTACPPPAASSACAWKRRSTARRSSRSPVTRCASMRASRSSACTPAPSQASPPETTHPAAATSWNTPKG